MARYTGYPYMYISYGYLIYNELNVALVYIFFNKTFLF